MAEEVPNPILAPTALGGRKQLQEGALALETEVVDGMVGGGR